MKTVVLAVCAFLAVMLVVLPFVTHKDKAICSIDVSCATAKKNGVELEVVIRNHSNLDIYVFGTEDSTLPVCLSSDREHWICCSSGNDVIEPGDERGMLVKSHEIMRVTGLLPKECMGNYWYINLGVGKNRTGIDSIEFMVGSPVYYFCEKNGKMAFKKMGMRR